LALRKANTALDGTIDLGALNAALAKGIVEGHVLAGDGGNGDNEGRNSESELHVDEMWKVLLE
jgi:hypothetical protein